MRVALIPLRKAASFGNTQKVTTGQNSGHGCYRVSSPIQCVYSTTPAPKAQGTLQKRGGNIVRARKLSVRMVSPRYDREAPPTQSQQDG